MRFKLTHRDLAMLTRFVIVDETSNASHNQCSVATDMEHTKVYITSTQYKQGMLVETVISRYFFVS